MGFVIPSCASVFGIGPAGDGFLDAFHESADAHKSLAPLIYLGINGLLLGLDELLAFAEPPAERFAVADSVPALAHRLKRETVDLGCVCCFIKAWLPQR